MLPPLLLAFTLLASVSYCHNSTYLNPIIPGFHPDPSCISVAKYNYTFFCTSSSFSAFPGIPIHASRDLVHWTLISNAINRPEQLPDLAITNKSTSGIWAATIRYREEEDLFYVSSTLVFDDQPETNNSRWENFVLTSSDPFRDSSWSDLVHFDFVGYDTSPYWDLDGTVYITGSHPWEVQPGINQAPINLATGEVGEIVNVWNGTGGEAPEGPHIYRKDGWYYLMIAEGGTGLNHMETIARSRNLNGPYDPNPNNPIVTQANTSSYFQTVGHADLFQDEMGQWWGVALSTRSGPNYTVYPMGRETVLAPVTWKQDGWPVWTNVSGYMNGWELPPPSIVGEGEGPLVTAPDYVNFAPGSRIPPQFIHWRIPIAENYVVSPTGHEYSLQLTSSKLNLTGYDGNYAGPQGQTFLGRRQVDTYFTFSVNMDVSDLRSEEDEAGVSVFLTQNHHFDLGVVMLSSPDNDTSSAAADPAPYFRFRGISYLPTPPEVLVPVDQTWLSSSRKVLSLEITTYNYTHYALSAAPVRPGQGQRHDWQSHENGGKREIIGLAPAADLSFGFTGTLVGVYATTNGREGSTRAWVSDWRYEGEGQVRTNAQAGSAATG